MRRLAFDLRTNHLSGIYRYGSNLLPNLAASMAGSGAKLFVLYGPNLDAERVEALSASLATFDVEMVVVPEHFDFARDSEWLREWLVRCEVDLYYSANYMVDILCPVTFIFTIHDLIRLKHPHVSYTEESFRQVFGEQQFEKIKSTLQALESYVPAAAEGEIFTSYFWAIMRYLAEQSLHIVTVSEAVRSDITRMLSVSPGKISVVPDAADPAYFYPRPHDEVLATLTRLSLSADQPYCLYVGLNHPHKRLPWLLEVLSGCVDKLPTGARLVIVGHYCAEDTALAEIIHNYGLDKLVVLTGHVSDDELACLYSSARSVAVTSVDEGFCLPALEALSCGCEVIAPELEALRETTDDYAHFYPPHDADLLAFYLTEAFNARLPRKGEHFRSRFSWAASAEQLSSIFQNFLSLLDEETSLLDS